MKIAVLGSGSEGNSVFVRANGTSILIDAGFSGKKIEQRLTDIGENPEEIQGIFVTHEHIDHIRGAGVLSRRYNISVYSTPGTFKRGHSIMGRLNEPVEIQGGKSLQIGDIAISPFDISHDATEPVGYVIECHGKRIGVCTDSGCVTLLMREKLKHCHALVLEMNHDPTMLLAGPYPWELKQRIRSRVGHLSNDDAGEFLSDLWHEELQHVFLAHLSKENNLPELVNLCARDALDKAGCPDGRTRLHVTSQDHVSDLVDI